MIEANNLGSSPSLENTIISQAYIALQVQGFVTSLIPSLRMLDFFWIIFGSCFVYRTLLQGLYTVQMFIRVYTLCQGSWLLRCQSWRLPTASCCRSSPRPQCPRPHSGWSATITLDHFILKYLSPWPPYFSGGLLQQQRFPPTLLPP